MIDLATSEKIQALLSAGNLSVRKIAEQTAVSPSTVCRIARRRTRLPKIVPEQYLIRPVRCRECGGRIVVLPCRLCRARRIANKVRADRLAAKSHYRRQTLEIMLRAGA